MEKNKSQPDGVFSAGSVFKNLKNIKAWRLIDEAGLRGKEINGAFVSNIHPNFIINNGKAKAEDVFRLMKYVESEVYRLNKI